jgi:hypothetical protein
MKIVKILLDDGTSKEIKEVKPFSFFEEKYPENSKWYHQNAYERQFSNFEDDIIELLDESNIKEYVKDHLNLVEEDDVEEKDISDFTDSEILEEIKDRRLGRGKNIINSIFIERFERIMDAENSILLDNILSELENKLKL